MARRPLVPLLIVCAIAIAAQDSQPTAPAHRQAYLAARTYRPTIIPLADAIPTHHVYYKNNTTRSNTSEYNNHFKPITSANSAQGSAINRRIDPVSRNPYSVNTTTAVSGRSFDEGRGKIKKKYKKYLLPLLLAYKLKFFTLIPLMMGGLVLLAGATGLAGFFFALFSATMGLKAGSYHK